MRLCIAVLVLALLSSTGRAQPVTAPPIAAKAYVLVDVLSGQTLAAAGENDRAEPASLTKVMTAYVVFAAMRDGKLDPRRSVTVSAQAARASGSRMFLTEGKPVTVDDLVRGMAVHSGNDAAISLAEAVAGTEEAFVALMNREAARLGLAATRFANATGHPAPEHYSSARDLATLTLALIRDFPDRYPVYAIREFAWNGISQSNRNRLLWTDPTVDGVKTGFTEAAGYCIVASAKRGARRLVAVVLGAQSDTLRTSESQKLLNFGFQAYETRRLYQKGQAVVQPEVYKGIRGSVPIGFDRDVWLTLPRERFTGIAAAVETRQPFVAPLAAGQKAGIMKVTRENATVAEFPVVALEDVPVGGFLSRGWDTIRLMFR
jgi:D-alanyl-D-alanine carboxypeptidase (penicillin-binding protein 5/6)